MIVWPTLPKAIKPLVSIILIISTLFIMVFLQMEERRLGYVLLKLNREYREVLDDKRDREILLAKYTRPQFVEKVAQNRLTLKKLTPGQIVHLSGEGLKPNKKIEKSDRVEKNRKTATAPPSKTGTVE